MNWRDFVIVTKPGIVIGNVLVGIGAFCFGAQKTSFDWIALAAFVMGMALVIAASCIFNNYYDRDIDRLMKRTAARPSVTGVLPLGVAIAYGVALLVVGVALLIVFVNWSTAIIGLIGSLLYAYVYSRAKRRTHHATLVGTIPGATPPLAGYVAATGQFDLAAWLLFALLVAWQMPHFYAISLFRREEYARARIPVLPVVKGVQRTIWEMRIYASLFLLSALAFTLYSGSSTVSGVLLCLCAMLWLSQIIRSPKHVPITAWARNAFKHSLYILPILSAVLILDRFW